AFALAAKLDRPVLLYIGSDDCRWCAETDRAIYTNPEIGSLINTLFVPIRVDRDERRRRAAISGGRRAPRRVARLAAHRVPHARPLRVLRRHVFPRRRSDYRPRSETAAPRGG